MPGASDVDLADWWALVEKWFDEIAPGIRTFVVPTPAGQSVVALYFETERAPYVVNTGQGMVTREVPYRSATRVRSARRHELIRLVVPEAQIPALEIINASIRCLLTTDRYDSEIVEVSGSGMVFFEGTGQVVLPGHRSPADLHLSGSGGDVETPITIRFSKPGGDSWFPVTFKRDTPRPPADPVPTYGVDIRHGDIYVTGPGKVKFSVNGTLPGAAFTMLRVARSGRFECKLGIAASDRSVTSMVHLQPDEAESRDDRVVWVAGSASDDS